MAWKSDLTLSVLIITSFTCLLPNDAQATDDTTLVLYHSSLDNRTVVPLDEPEKLVPKLNFDFITVIFLGGYMSSDKGPVVQAMLNTYISCGNYNVILGNWTTKASNPYPTTAQGYLGYAVPNSKEVGDRIGLAVVTFVRFGVIAAKLHLIGFSLGAHAVGCAGRKAKSLGVIVNRVTGLDPARVGFEPALTYTPINQDSGRFVDCHHTDSGSCGMTTSPCHINFYYNAENYFTLTGSHVQPGCQPGYELCGNLCSHNRAPYYWMEAVKYPKNFLARKAENYYLDYANTNAITTYVGYLCNDTYRGDFYLCTNAESPYGKQEAGLPPCSASTIL